MSRKEYVGLMISLKNFKRIVRQFLRATFWFLSLHDFQGARDFFYIFFLKTFFFLCGFFQVVSLATFCLCENLN